eukprot:Skav217131  [mRNA]  locus=scaffold427:34756:37139:+ [translate_table: standard]
MSRKFLAFAGACVPSMCGAATGSTNPGDFCILFAGHFPAVGPKYLGRTVEVSERNLVESVERFLTARGSSGWPSRLDGHGRSKLLRDLPTLGPWSDRIDVLSRAVEEVNVRHARAGSEQDEAVPSTDEE